MRRLTVAEFHAELRAQGVADREDIALRCPICGTIQSARDMIAAGAGKTMDEVQKYLGFSCVGKLTNAGPHKKGAAPGRGCDWTLGGLFRLHTLVVVDDDGREHPHFEPAEPDEAQAHAERRRGEPCHAA